MGATCARVAPVSSERRAATIGKGRDSIEVENSAAAGNSITRGCEVSQELDARYPLVRTGAPQGRSARRRTRRSRAPVCGCANSAPMLRIGGCRSYTRKFPDPSSIVGNRGEPASALDVKAADEALVYSENMPDVLIEKHFARKVSHHWWTSTAVAPSSR